jgi:hypothetical protein
MKICKPALILFAVMAFVVALQAPACAAEERFGPWVYYAPYYFPQGNSCMGYFLTPLDWLPKYESPNPPRPSYGGPCLNPGMPAPPPRKVTRHASRGAHVAPPMALSPAPPRSQMNQSQFGSSLKPIRQSGQAVSSGPRLVNHPGPPQRMVPAQGTMNQGR